MYIYTRIYLLNGIKRSTFEKFKFHYMHCKNDFVVVQSVIKTLKFGLRPK